MALTERSRGMRQGGQATQRQDRWGAKCTCQLEFQSLDITDLPFTAAARPDGADFQNAWHCWSIVGQICIIIREDWGKLLVIFWLGCQLSCEMPCKVTLLPRNEFLKISAVQGGNFLTTGRDQSPCFSQIVPISVPILSHIRTCCCLDMSTCAYYIIMIHSSPSLFTQATWNIMSFPPSCQLNKTECDYVVIARRQSLLCLVSSCHSLLSVTHWCKIMLVLTERVRCTSVVWLVKCQSACGWMI